MSSAQDGLGATAPLYYELLTLASISLVCLGYTLYHCQLHKARLFSLFYLMVTSNFALFSFSCYGFAAMYYGSTTLDLYDMAFPIQQLIYYIFLHVRSRTLMSDDSARYVAFLSGICNFVNVTLGLLSCFNASLASDPNSFVQDPNFIRLDYALTILSLVLMCALDLFYFYLFFSRKRHAEKMLTLPVTMQIVVTYSFFTSINTIVYYIVTVAQSFTTSTANIALTFIININQFLFCLLQLLMKIEIDKHKGEKSSNIMSYSQPPSKILQQKENTLASRQVPNETIRTGKMEIEAI